MTVEQRIETIERSLRHWRLIAIVGLIFGVAGTAGVVSGWQGLVPEVLKARRLEIVNDAGDALLVAETIHGQSGRLRLFDEKGKDRTWMEPGYLGLSTPEGYDAIELITARGFKTGTLRLHRFMCRECEQGPDCTNVAHRRVSRGYWRPEIPPAEFLPIKKVEDAKTELQLLKAAVKMYAMKEGKLPFEGAWPRSLLEPSAYVDKERFTDGQLLDPWGHPYVYRKSGKNFEILSHGSDGTPGGGLDARDLSSNTKKK